jgi:mono/diheme cytochrome c family protein
VTEVPDYLLERSRSRRQALGLLGDDEGGAPAAPAGGGAVAAPERPAAAAAPAAAAPADVVVVEEPPPPDPDWVVAAKSRHKIPMWVLPVLFVLPFWAYVYVAFLGETAEQGPLEVGQEVYTAQGCAGCHGATGAGGIGQVLWQGEVLLTFPDVASQMEWIQLGSVGFEEQFGAPAPYGDPDRPGGQRNTGELGSQMNGFGGNLTPAELYAVSRYVRETLSGEELTEEELVLRDVMFEELAALGDVTTEAELAALGTDIHGLMEETQATAEEALGTGG